MDTDTFTDKKIIDYSDKNFINLKINTDTDSGHELFKKFHGVSLPTILFLDSNANEIDRIVGYSPPEEYLKQINNINNNINTLEYFLNQLQFHPDSAAINIAIGNKYLERNIIDKATQYFDNVIDKSSANKKYYQEAKYRLAFIEYENNNLEPLLNFIEKNQNSDFTYSGLRTVIRYYKSLQDTMSELQYYEKLIMLFPSDPNALNSYGWRMSELDRNLKDALEKTKLAVSLTNEDLNSKANILDTEAEILWKLGRINEAIEAIEKAIKINPNKEYFKNQKKKFIES